MGSCCSRRRVQQSNEVQFLEDQVEELEIRTLGLEQDLGCEVVRRSLLQTRVAELERQNLLRYCDENVIEISRVLGRLRGIEVRLEALESSRLPPLSQLSQQQLAQVEASLR